MTRFLTTVLLSGALASLSACALPQAESPPTRYYLLQPVEEEAARGTDPQATIGLEPVELPAYLDRQDIVTRESATRLRVATLDRWAEPLDANVSRVLAQNLRRLLDREKVVLLPVPARPQSRELFVELFRFERQPTGEVALEAAWRLYDAETREELWSASARLTEPVEGESYDATVAAMSRAIAALSRRIAESLRARAG